MLSRTWTATANARNRTEAPPSSLFDLAEILQKGNAPIEIARANLLCAHGLPGAENLEIETSLAALDRWAEHVQHETDRHLYRFKVNPSEYENSESYFRVLMLIVALQGDLGVHYNRERINQPDFTNSKDLFIHGMIGDVNGGTCVSMPALYVAVGRRLGYPLKLVVTKGHVFARWEDERERFNIEAAGRGLTTETDDYYKTWPYKLTDAEANNGWFLRSLTPAEELALFLMQRGHCLQDTDRVHEAQVAYAMAHRFAPKSPEAFAYLTELVRKESAQARAAHPEAPAAQASRDSNQAWLHEKRREAEDIARQAIEQQPGQHGPAVGPIAPSPNGPLIPGAPSFPGGGN